MEYSIGQEVILSGEWTLIKGLLGTPPLHPHWASHSVKLQFSNNPIRISKGDEAVSNTVLIEWNLLAKNAIILIKQDNK